MTKAQMGSKRTTVKLLTLDPLLFICTQQASPVTHNESFNQNICDKPFNKWLSKTLNV
jgi:hypothetical protein